MSDSRDSRAQRAEIIDISRVCVHRFRERFRLIAALLVRLVEHILQLRMMREHALVEVFGDRCAVFGEHRYGGFDAGDLVGGKNGHDYFSLKMHLRYIFKKQV